MENELDRIVWQEPWRRLADPQVGERLGKELAQEANPRHILYRKAVTAVAITGDDDVLFLVHDQLPRLAVVHLTWGAKPDPHDKFPFTLLLDTVDAFVAHMASDHDFQIGSG